MVYGIKGPAVLKHRHLIKALHLQRLFPVAIFQYAKAKKASLYRQGNAPSAWVFLPAKLGSYDLPNPLIMISGERALLKQMWLTWVLCFEKVFTKPYDIAIILHAAEQQWHMAGR